jgi:hypothetical protein
MGREPETGVEGMLGPHVERRQPWEGRVELGQRIAKVEVPEFPRVRLTFADGFIATLDFSSRLEIGKAFAQLRDPTFFATAHIGANGASLEWITTEGDEIDFCADALRMEAEGIWDPINRIWKV